MPRAEGSEPETPTILVVDDTPDSLRFLTRTLTSAGMKVLIAVEGLAALDLLDHVTPDLILMDATMPNLDGFETTRRIKANPAFQHLPIIFMTGLTETEHVVRGLGAGAIDYVTKPIVIDELIARIRVHLANARIAQGSQLALDVSGRPVLAIDAAGALHWLTPMASEMLEGLFAGWSSTSGTLPKPFLSAIRDIRESEPNTGASATLELEGVTLEIGFLRRTVAGQWLFRLSQRGEGEERRLLAIRHGLTAREAEVLLWISRGKQNRDVSEILQISPRTVNKHLEQIFEKMGVENRASAAAIAATTLSR